MTPTINLYIVIVGLPHGHSTDQPPPYPGPPVHNYTALPQTYENKRGEFSVEYQQQPAYNPNA